MAALGQADKLAQITSSESESELDKPKLSEERENFSTHTEKQRIIILSLVSSEHYSKTQVMELFGCTKHKVDIARKRQGAFRPLQQRPEKRQFRQKLEFLFGSNLMEDVTYGTTVIKSDSGEKQVLPRAILTATRSRAVQDYKRHCRENLSLLEDECLSDSTLWKILRNIKQSQKRAMVGFDNVTANDLKGFLLLEDVVITSLTDAKLRQLEQSKRYLKIGYRMHCETLSSCENPCISFAISNKIF